MQQACRKKCRRKAKENMADVEATSNVDEAQVEATSAEAAPVETTESVDAAETIATPATPESVDTDAVEATDAAAADTDPEINPVDAFKKELRHLPGKWYVIHSYAGFEKRVKTNLIARKANATIPGGESIFQVEVPMEEVVEVKNAVSKRVTRVRIPGYVLVRMELNEDSWSLVRHTPGVTGFVGNAYNPTPLRVREAFDMLKGMIEIEQHAAEDKAAAKDKKSKAKAIPTQIDFEIGETITINDGSFMGLPGTINEIKPESGKLIVLVSLFERETPVELSFDQVTKLQ